MRIIVIFWLLIACIGIAVLSQVGNDSLSRDLNCSEENVSEIFSELFYHCKYHLICIGKLFILSFCNLYFLLEVFLFN